MKIKKTRFDMKLTAVMASFIVIAAVFLGVGAKNAGIFDPANSNITTNSSVVPKTATKEDKKTEELLKKFKKEGFSEKEIGEALSLAQYIENKLTNISQDNHVDQSSVPKPEIVNPIAQSSSNEEEDLTSYKKLAEKFDLNTSVELMLKMKKDLGSMGNVMDEYLFSIQAEINLKDYIGKITEYQKLKKEKSAFLTASSIITTQKIDEKLLKKLQKQNKNTADNEQTNIRGKLPQAGKGVDVSGVQKPSVPLPNVPKPGVPNQSETINGANLRDTVDSETDQPNVALPIVPGQNDGVSQPNINLPYR